MPSGSKIRVRSTSANGWPAARAAQHAEHRGAGVVHPALARLGEQRQAAERRDPGVRVGLQRPAAGGPMVPSRSSLGRRDDRPRPWRGEHLRDHAEAEREGQQVPGRDRRGARARCPQAGRPSWSGHARSASSGSSRSTGSSRSSRPSPTRASVAAAVIGLVVEAMRNSESLADRRAADGQRPERLDVHLARRGRPGRPARDPVVAHVLGCDVVQPLEAFGSQLVSHDKLPSQTGLLPLGGMAGLLQRIRVFANVGRPHRLVP